MKGLKLLLYLILGSLVALFACNNSECYDNKNSLPLAGFYSGDSIPRAISLDSISIYGLSAPGDSILHDSIRGLSQTYLPFRIDDNETTYVFNYLSGVLGELHISDTISFYYDIEPWFVSSACGAVYYYIIKDIVTTHNIIDSVTCPTGIINNINEQNIKIYFHTEDSDNEETE